jgi:hypothetical protein
MAPELVCAGKAIEDACWVEVVPMLLEFTAAMLGSVAFEEACWVEVVPILLG